VLIIKMYCCGRCLRTRWRIHGKKYS